jgi:nitroimidazol reductase NimA-like FMN-containing flavoprotein (pyridoxamine 5'-phosphate oxidase superfamily)
VTVVIDVEQLTDTACLQLLATVRVGRVALTQHALPVVLSVSFALDGASLVLRTRRDSVLARSRDDIVVAFEASELDPESGSGWSVLVTGTMQKIIEPNEIERALQSPPSRWSTDDHHVFVRITPGLISGTCAEHRSDQTETSPALA